MFGFLKMREMEAKIAAIGRSQAVIEFRMDGTILDANTNFLDAMGYTLAEVKGKHHSMFVERGERSSAAYREFWERLRAGEYLTAEYRRVGKGGEDIWIQGAYNPMLDRRGVPFKVIKYAQVITEEVKRRGKIALLSLVADETDNSVVITDANGVTEYVNPGFTRLTGYTFEDVKGKKPGKMLQGKHTNPATVELIRKRLAAREPFYDEILNYTKSGEPYWISLSINPVFGAGGALQRFVSIQANVSVTKLASIEHADRMDAIERSNAVVEWDAGGHLKRLNGTALTLLGLKDLGDAETLRSLSYTELFTAEQRSALAADESLLLTLSVRNRQGADVHISATAQSLRDVEGVVQRVVLYGSDVTSRRQAVQAADGLMSNVLERVSQVATEISSISFQTDVLAVNASIEAARAGGVGRGFAVVADAVRGLSSRSSVLTEEVALLVSETRGKIETLRGSY